MPAMFGKILFVALQQRGHVCRRKVDLSANLLALPGREPTEAKIGVQAARDALKQFLKRLPRRGENHLFIRAERANEPVVRHKWAERTRVHVGARHVWG